MQSLKSYATSKLKSPTPPRVKDKYGKLKPLTRSQAEQIAHLLNQYNGLQSVYEGNRILDSKAVYYPQHEEGYVFGSIALQRWNFFMTEVKHLVVHPLWRGLGLGKVMLAQVLPLIDTPIVYATIREDNTPSIHLFTETGFRNITKVKVRDHEVLMLIKKNEQSNPKPVSQGELTANFKPPRIPGTRENTPPFGGGLGIGFPR